MADTETQQAPEISRKTSGVGSTTASAKKNIKSKATDAKSQAQGTDDGTNNELEEQTDSGVDGLTSSAEEDNKIQEDDDEASEVVPAGSVNKDGEVISEAGKVVGHVNSQDASELEGSFVDLEGDVLDKEGNIIGHADVDEKSLKELDPKPVDDGAEGTKSQAGDVKSQVDEAEKPEVKGSEKPELDDAKKTAEGVEKPDLEGTEKLEVSDVDKSKVEASIKSKVTDDDKADLGEKSALGDKSELGDNSESTLKPDVLDVEGSEKPEIPDIEGSEKPVLDVEGSQKPDVQDVDKSELAEGVDKPNLAGPFGVQENGEITNAAGEVVGKLVEGTPQDLVGTSIKEINDEGNLVAKSGSILGKADLVSNLLEKADEAKLELVGPFDINSQNEVLNAAGQVVANLPEGEKHDLDVKSIKEIDSQGNLKNKDGSILAKAELIPGLLDAVSETPDLSILKGMTVNKLGKIVDKDGNPHGVLVEGEVKKLLGRKVDAEGKIWDDSGKVIGRAELLPEDQREAEPSAPFEDFPGAVLNAKGEVIFEDRVVGKLIEGDAKKLEGKKVDADGDVLDKNGNTVGKAERYQEEEVVPEEAAPEEPEDLSDLEGKKVNKAGNVVDDNGKLFGRVNSGVLAKLIGKKCDAEGKIWSDSGKVIGTAELIPIDDRDEKSDGPFEDFPDAVVDSKGNVISDGKIIGKLIEGDAKMLSGKKVDADGEVVDKIGNVLGKAERWEEPEPEEAPMVDSSALAGKRVNKSGNIVDSNGQIYGRLIEGDPRKLAGKMCDKDGNVWNEGGTIVGRAEVVPESEREGQKEGPFSGFDSPTVTKDGKVADSKGNIIGRLIEGEAANLYGKLVDSDGDVIDKNGNTIGKAERWEEEVKEKKKNPVAGRKINRDGNVLDDDGDVIGRLVEGEIGKCVGKEIDDDGDITNSKGVTLGHVSLLEDIPEPEPEPKSEVEAQPEPEDPEEVERKKQLAIDTKLAKQMAGCIQQSIDKIKPILRMITDAIDTAEAQPKEELDEQKLVDTVKPLIEEGGGILQEANGVIRGLDPDGRIASQAKAKSAGRDATPEEYHLADVLKELTENVTTTIEKAKKKIAGMPHAKKELNPLWGLLAEPLGQILAAVGLLLAGVLGLVGRLLSGLGLGGLLDNLLGGLGIKGILKGLGLGMVTDVLTGKKK